MTTTLGAKLRVKFQDAVHAFARRNDTRDAAQAALHGSVSTLGRLIRHGINLDAPVVLDSTMMMIAASFDKARFVQALIDAGASTDVQNSQGLTARDVAEASGSRKTIKVLARAEAKQGALGQQAVKARNKLRAAVGR